jgi:outer membrane protein assembly factor BamD (BamD/ComL family)
MGNLRSKHVKKLEALIWANIKNSNQADDYTAYLEKFPNGQFAKQARQKLEALIWANIKDSADDYTAYLEKFPNGQFAKQARQKLEALIWANIKNSNQADDYTAYLEKFPNGQFAKVADEKRENLLWTQAKIFNNLNKYKTYLKSYPDGKYASQVFQRINALQYLESNTRQREMTMCVSVLFISPFEAMNCSGDFNGSATMVELARNGWEFKGDIARANNFILIFQR